MKIPFILFPSYDYTSRSIFNVISVDKILKIIRLGENPRLSPSLDPAMSLIYIIRIFNTLFIFFVYEKDVFINICSFITTVGIYVIGARSGREFYSLFSGDQQKIFFSTD